MFQRNINLHLFVKCYGLRVATYFHAPLVIFACCLQVLWEYKRWADFLVWSISWMDRLHLFKVRDSLAGREFCETQQQFIVFKYTLQGFKADRRSNVPHFVFSLKTKNIPQNAISGIISWEMREVFPHFVFSQSNWCGAIGVEVPAYFPSCIAWSPGTVLISNFR